MNPAGSRNINGEDSARYDSWVAKALIVAWDADVLLKREMAGTDFLLGQKIFVDYEN